MIKFSTKIWFIAFLLFVSLIGIKATAGFTFTQNLTLGARGDDVSALQQFLIAGGYLKIPAPTSYFGPLTRAALGAWQASLNIYPPAGFFGPISRSRINADISRASIDAALLQNTTSTTAPSTTTTSTSSGYASSSITGNGSPLRLKIPKLNVDAGFQYNGLDANGVMEIPTNIVDVGWYTGSVRPGQIGTAVVTGHVAQIRGGIMTKPGVFNNLGDLRAGDKLYVQNDKGETIEFVVRESRLYDPVADATDVFTSSDGVAHLNIITCEGTWNPDQLSYSQRLVVFTDAVK